MNTDLLIRISAFLGILILMGCWESLAPRRQTPSQKSTRWVINLGISGINVLVLRMLFMSGGIGTAIFAETTGWGFFNLVMWPEWVESLIALIMLDLVVYGQHVLFHTIPFLWSFHKVHHSDTALDVTTGVRFHPGEMGISMLIKMGTIIVIGVSPGVVLIFEVLLNATAMFNHSNIRIPLSMDQWLRWLVVTPDMHRIHHSVLAEETNRNYGFNLSCWDRAFRTYQRNPSLGHEYMPLGLEQFRNPTQLTVLRLLALPFIKEPEHKPLNHGVGDTDSYAIPHSRIKNTVKPAVKVLT
ncbi:sterol desaturase family protein [Nitrospira sp. M1]